MAGQVDPPFFRSWKEICDWDRQIAFCGFVDLPEAEREKAKEGLRFLRDVFGSGFADKASEVGHPLFRELADLSPWKRKWIAWFANALLSLADSKSRENLIHRLRDAERFYEAMSVLEVAYEFSLAGFNAEIDPAVVVRGAEKRPDILLVDPLTAERLYVEVTETAPSEESRHADRTFRAIGDSLFQMIARVSYCGVVNRILDEPQLRRSLEAVKQAVEGALQEGGLHQVKHDALDVAVVRRGDEGLLTTWAEARGLAANTLTGPRYDFKEPVRTLRKMRDEQAQLPEGIPSIVAIWNPWLFLPLTDPRPVIEEISARLNLYPHVLAVVVAGKWLGAAQERTQQLSTGVFLTRKRFDVMERKMITVFNRACRLSLSDHTQRRIRVVLGIEKEPST